VNITIAVKIFIKKNLRRVGVKKPSQPFLHPEIAAIEQVSFPELPSFTVCKIKFNSPQRTRSAGGKFLFECSITY
jgi:hypothetical protein